MAATRPASSHVLAALKPVESSRDYLQVVLTLPKAHVRVLDMEACILGLRRSQLLELLLLNDLGHRCIHRMDIAPRYTFVRQERTESDRILWYVRPGLKPLLEEHILRLGLRPSPWAVLALNTWARLTKDEESLADAPTASS